MPEAVQQQAERELSRFERMGDSNAEGSMIRTCLDWLLAIPWGKRSAERLDPQHARDVLDQDHAGLDVNRITEYLAVRKLVLIENLIQSRRTDRRHCGAGPGSPPTPRPASACRFRLATTIAESVVTPYSLRSHSRVGRGLPTKRDAQTQLDERLGLRIGELLPSAGTRSISIRAR